MKCSAIALFALFAADVLCGDAPETAVPTVAQVRFAEQVGRRPHEKGLRIAGIVLKWIRADKEANFRRVEPMIRQAAAGGAQIVCTTECFLDGYAIADKSIPLDVYRSLGEPIPEGAYFKRLAALARELKIVLVAGPDGSVLQQTVLGDVLRIPPADAGTAKDANRVFHVDLPPRAPERKTP